MTDTSNPTAVVQTMFNAFRAGDIEALLETIHPDSRWVYVGANPKPVKREYIGKAEVKRFFEGILRRLDMMAFNTDEFIMEGDTVVVFGSESGTVKATGQQFHNEWTQKYVVQDNLITQMVEYNIQIESQDVG
jgi:ketosteroid isomerase-like protein